MQRPKLTPSSKSLRHIRIEEIGAPQISHAGEESSWAVSYADLLMVLMSFFIIFFSFDDKTPVAIDAITMALKGKTEAQIIYAKGKPFEGVAASQTTSPLLEALSRSLHSKNIEAQSKKRFLVINLPDNIYAARSYIANKDVKSELDTILSVLKDYKEQINITFIGHSDPAPVTARGGVLKNNFVLSALRATQALEIGTQAGFAPETLFTQGDAFNTRKTRSLSLKIELRGHANEEGI